MTCCREVLGRSVVGKCVWGSVVEKCCREVLVRSVIEKCWCAVYLSMAYSPLLHIYWQVILFRLFRTTFDYFEQRKKTAEKIDTNAQWFHCSWSILLKRVNIRVRGFHLVLFFIIYHHVLLVFHGFIVFCSIFDEHVAKSKVLKKNYQK